MSQINLTELTKERIRGHSFVVDGVLTHPFEALHMGNGDLGASVNLFSHEIKITMAKTDVWDARYDGKPEKWALKHDDLIAMMKEKERDLLCQFPNLDGQTGDDYHFETPACGHAPYVSGPAPKRVGAIRIYHPGLSDTVVSSKLDILTGIQSVYFSFQDSRLIVHAFLHKTENMLWIQVEADGPAPWFSLVLEKDPDDTDRTMPPPKTHVVDEYFAGMSQTIPAGLGIEEFRWDLVGKFPQKTEDGRLDSLEPEQHAFKLRQYCSLKAGEKVEFCVAVCTTRDGGANTFERAVSLLNENIGKYEAKRYSHLKAWEDFWITSGVELEDKELEASWYRNHFHYECALRRGTTALGGAGNTAITDYTPWHGDCKMNHNFQKWYITALPVNRPEWIDIYADFIADKMETFEYQADLIFGLEGVFCEHSYFPVATKEQCNINNYMRSLALTGWLAQPLWWHWEYMQDKQWLQSRGYPYIKKAAQFYWNYLEKYQDESGDIYPSMRIEEPGWLKGFKGNRNVISDLVMFKKTFEWAIASSEALNLDEEWRVRWQNGLKRIPPIPFGWDGDEAWIGLDKHWERYEEGVRADYARYNRWGGGGWAVFPGEYISGDEEDELTKAYRDLIGRVDLLNPFYSKVHNKNMYPGVPILHPISSIIPAIRLGLRDKFEDIRKIILSHRQKSGQSCSYMLKDGQIPKEVRGYYGFLWYDWRSVENKYLGVIGTVEMLLQSQGGAIRFFPLWPDDQKASFQNFRARGGFIVSAVKDTHNRVDAEIISTAGHLCRIRTDKKVQVIAEKENVPIKRDGRDVVFDTKTEQVYNVSIG